MKVHQEDFQTLKYFHNLPKFRKGTNNPGVYVWGFSLESMDYTIPTNSKMFLPYYLGKVEKQNGCMYQRTQEHLASLIGGNTSIFDISSIIASSGIFPDFGKIHLDYQKISKAAKKKGNIGPNLPNVNYPFLLHFPEGIHRMLHFTTDPKIKTEIDWMLRHFCITYFKLDTYNKNDINELEKYVGNIIGYDRLITKRYEKPNLRVEIVGDKNNVIINEYEHLFPYCGEMM